MYRLPLCPGKQGFDGCEFCLDIASRPDAHCVYSIIYIFSPPVGQTRQIDCHFFRDDFNKMPLQ